MVAVINERLRCCRHAAPLVAAIYYLPMFHSSSFSFEPLNVLSSFSSAPFIFQSFFCIVDNNNNKKKKLSRWINPTAAFTQSTRVAVVNRDSFFFFIVNVIIVIFFIPSGEERLVCAAQLAVLTFGRHLHLC